MSSFNDATFRSQQMLAPYQMQGAMNRQAGIQRIGDAAVQAAGNYNQARNQAAELAIRTTEANVKIASFQQEQQLNAYKLQQLMSLDQAAMSRFGVDQAGMQVEMMGYERDKAKASAKYLESQTGAMHAKESNLLYEGALKSHKILDNGKLRDPKDDAEWERFKSDYQFAESAGRSQSSISPEYQRMAQISREMDRQRRIIDGNWSSDEEKANAQRRLDALGPEYDSAMQEAGIGGRSGAGSGMVPPGPQPGQPGTHPPQPMPETPSGTKPRGMMGRGFDDNTFNYVATQAYKSPAWEQDSFWQSFAPDDQTKVAMAEGIAHMADSLVNFQHSNGLNLDPAMSHEYVMHFAKQNPAIMGSLLMMTGDSEEEVRMKLAVAFPNLSKAGLDMAVAKVHKTAEQMRTQ